MALVAMESVGDVGIQKDIPPWQLPPNAWSDGNNVRAWHGSIEKIPGYAEVMATCPVPPYYITYLAAGISKYFIVGGTAKIYVYDATTNVDQLNGSLTDAATTVTVDSTTGFESKGTITIGSEQITYTGKTATTFTTCTRGANSTTAAAHSDDAVVTRTKKWHDITRASGDYSATAAEGWSSTILGGILILVNPNDDPQFWALTSGLPNTGTVMADLTNWPASTECAVVKSFKSFLVSLNVTKSSVNYPTLVKWSTEAATQTVPSSWDETSSTLDAGEYPLQDGGEIIRDGLQLGDTFQIYTSGAVHQMSYVGTPFIFSFRKVSPVGVMAKNCVAEFPGGHFILGNDDLYVNDGQRLLPILPSELRDWMFNLIDGEAAQRSFVVADHGRNEILSCFVSADSLNTQIDKAVVFNYVTRAFTIRDLPQLSHITAGVVDDPTGFTTWAAATPTWTTADGRWAMSFDLFEDALVFASPISTKLFRDGSGNQEDTTDMTAFIERTGLSLTSQGSPDQTSVKRVQAIWPKMEILNQDTVDIYVGTQMSTEEAITWKGPFTFNPDTMSKVSCRATGKLYGVKIESTGDTHWKLSGLAFELEDAGRRGSRGYS